MSLTVTYPHKNLINSGAQSRWYAAHSPFIISIQRKDLTVNSTTNNSGNVVVTIAEDISDPANLITAGDEIYINSGDVVGVYEVLSVDTTHTFTIDLAYVAGTGAGYVNLVGIRTNYYIKTIVEKYDDTLSSHSSFDLNITRPNTSGLAKADITRINKNAVNLTDDFTHNAMNSKDTNLSAALNLSFVEVWDGSDNAAVEDEDYFIVNAAMQFQHRYGSNMADYMMESTGDDKAKWLSASSKIRHYAGYPFDLSFIIPSPFSAITIYKNELTNEGNINVSDDDYELDNTQAGFVNRLMLENSYTSDIDNVDIYIKSTVVLTEAINVRFTCIRKNPVYLKWVDRTTGGWNFFMFTVTQARTSKIASLGLFSRFIEELATAEGDSEFLGKTATVEMTMGAEMLDSFDVLLMESLLTSTRVLMLANPDEWEDEGEKWQVVRIEPGNYLTRHTKNVFNKIEFKMLLPETFIQTQ